MRGILIATAVILLVSPNVIFAGKPDPSVPNPPLQVLEHNIDGNGWIAVHEQGTADVNVTGGSIDADVSGSTVDVNVINTPARIPWSFSRNATTDGNAYKNFWFMNYPDDYPEGTILVIETFSYSADLPPGENVSVMLTTQGGGELRVFDLNMPQTTGISLGGVDVYQDHASVRAYAGGEGYIGDSVSVKFQMTSSTTGYDLEISLSGYFIPEDSPSLAP